MRDSCLLICLAVALVLVAWLRPNVFGTTEDAFIDRQIHASSVSSLTPIVPEIPMPELDLKSAIAINLANHFYLLRFNTNHRWPMASLTKLLTAVVALENLNNQPGVRELVKQMMVVSSNDAAEQLANLGGNRQRFIEKMRAKVEVLGMTQTSIFEPTGLSFLNQSTASDLKKLVDYIIKKQPSILQFSRQKEGNINRFAGRSDFLGGKTGYTDEASGNLISIFQHNGHPILIIALGATGYEERFDQTELILKWISKSYN